jgi:hypothetical protein
MKANVMVTMLRLATTLDAVTTAPSVPAASIDNVTFGRACGRLAKRSGRTREKRQNAATRTIDETMFAPKA